MGPFSPFGKTFAILHDTDLRLAIGLAFGIVIALAPSVGLFLQMYLFDMWHNFGSFQTGLCFLFIYIFLMKNPLDVDFLY